MAIDYTRRKENMVRELESEFSCALHSLNLDPCMLEHLKTKTTEFKSHWTAMLCAAAKDACLDPLQTFELTLDYDSLPKELCEMAEFKTLEKPEVSQMCTIYSNGLLKLPEKSARRQTCRYVLLCATCAGEARDILDDGSLLTAAHPFEVVLFAKKHWQVAHNFALTAANEPFRDNLNLDRYFCVYQPIDTARYGFVFYKENYLETYVNEKRRLIPARFLARIIE